MQAHKVVHLKKIKQKALLPLASDEAANFR